MSIESIAPYIDAHKERRRAAKAEYQRRYNTTENGQEARRRYRHGKSKWLTDAQYLARPVVAIDGEGVNRRNGDHHYLLLAISGVAPLVSQRRLTTRQCLDYLWKNLDAKNLNVIFGGGYDFNMWVRDLGSNALKRLYKSHHSSRPVQYGPYLLRWSKGKEFSIKRGDKTVIVYDVYPFFQRPFIGACDEYLGAYDGREILVREKARRGDFRPDELAGIADYNNLELELLVRLVRELRERLNRVTLRPARWNGPGAIAAALLRRECVKEHMGNPPSYAARAARFAYFGGRFEVIRYGKSDNKAYEYDLNSAYPAALQSVPSLAGANWVTYSGDAGPKDFAIYHVQYDGSKIPENIMIPAPVPIRHENGAISYPIKADGWIWSPEMEALRLYCKTIKGAKYKVLETVYCEPATDIKPFAFIPALYVMRKLLKAAGDGAHIGIKLALNSLYGKLAQQVGYVPATANHPERIPTYHQLEWAGYTTSYCRAAVLTAALSNIKAVIAFETDALFSSEPLDIDLGEGLGQFEVTEFESLTYVQSGHYYATLTVPTKDGATEVIKCRGVDRGYISRERVEEALQLPEDKRYLSAALTRFMGAGIALARGLHIWCRWITEPKELALMPSGKRLHGACFCGNGGGPLELGVWHSTYCPVWEGVSNEYPVAWINPNPAMSELEDLRNSETDGYDAD